MDSVVIVGMLVGFFSSIIGALASIVSVRHSSFFQERARRRAHGSDLWQERLSLYRSFIDIAWQIAPALGGSREIVREIRRLEPDSLRCDLVREAIIRSFRSQNTPSSFILKEKLYELTFQCTILAEQEIIDSIFEFLRVCSAVEHRILVEFDTESVDIMSIHRAFHATVNVMRSSLSIDTIVREFDHEVNKTQKN